MKFIPSQLLRFAATGTGATLLHIASAIFLINECKLPTVVANGIAFGVATVFSYLCNTQWSFQGNISCDSIFRFIFITAINLALVLTLSACMENMHWHYGFGIAISVILLPMMNYLAHRHFTYAKHI